MENGGLQGWAADPFQLHQERYFSAGRPTKLVRDGKTETYDDPPDPTTPAATATTTAAPSPTATLEPASASDTLSPTPTTAPSPERSPAAPAPAPSPGPGVPTSPGDAAQPSRPARPASPARYPGAAPPYADHTQYAGRPRYAGATGRREPGPDRGAGPPSRPRAGLFVAAALVILVAVLAAVKLVHGSGSTTDSGQAPPASPAALVTRSAQQTLAERTVDISLSGTLQIAGTSLGISGTGETNFSTDATSFTLHANAPGGALDETELLVDGNLYYSLSINGANMAELTGGRKWIQMPVQQSAEANLVGSDPVTSLSTLEQQGSTVRVLGTQVIDGVTCTGYDVTPSTQAMLAGASKLGLSSATTDQELQAIRSMSPPTVTIWIDAEGIVRQMNINLQINVQGTGDSADMTIDFSHFGAPVTVTPPAPSDTISFSSFLQKLGETAPA